MTQLQATKIEELKNSFRGEILLPSDDAYESAPKIWNATIDKHPACTGSGRRNLPDREVQIIKRLLRSFASGSIVPVVILIVILQGPVGLPSSAFGSCPDARFAPQVAVPAAAAAEGIAVADLNADGNLDLSVTNFTAGGGISNSVAILLGDGHGTFGTPTRFAVGHGASRVIASDFNADGKTDLAVLNTNDGTVSVLLGDGLGGFGPQATFRTGGVTPGLALGDFNEDGNSDLVVSDPSTAGVTVLLGIGDGSFSAPSPFPVGGHPALVAVGDLNADGRLDLAVNDTFDASVSILFGNGDGTFGPPTVVPMPGGFFARSLAVSDLDGDGILDMAVVNAFDDTVLVLLGQGDGSFGLPVAFAVGEGPMFVAVADLNNDAIPDLAVGNANEATVSVLLGRGDGTFGSQIRLAVGNTPIPVAVGDFNRDGVPDLVAGNFADQTVSVLLNECTGNRPPMASAGPDQILECTGDLQATAGLDASGSKDLDSTPGTNDDIASFDWSEQGRLLASGPTASIPFLLGTHAVSLKVTDKAGATDSDAVNIAVQDTTPPVITSIVANPSSLSPPNHKLVPVSIIAVATDRCDAAPSCKIVSVTSSELGKGFAIGRSDAVISDPGPKTSPAMLAVLLRAKRAGPGRIYTINVSCGDAAGNVTSGQTTVTVAHYRGLVRLPVSVHRRRTSLDFSTRPAAPSAVGEYGIFRLPSEVFPNVHRVSDRAGLRCVSRYRRTEWCFPLLFTASAPRSKLLSRRNTGPHVPLSALRRRCCGRLLGPVLQVIACEGD